MKTNTKTESHKHQGAPDAALLRDVEELLQQGYVGNLHAPAEVLAALFELAALHLVGEQKRRAESLASWYRAEQACA